MLTLLSAALGFLISISALPQGQPVRSAGDVQGAVRVHGTDELLAGVVVTLTGVGGAPAMSVVTDAEGAFRFSDVQFGRYTLAATKPGYVRTEYGAIAPARPGRPVSLSAKTSPVRVAMELFPGAVITGRVVDTFGNPAPHQYVDAIPRRWTPQGPRLAAAAGRGAVEGFFGPMTDEQGVYRIYGLPPGEYLVAVGERSQQASPPVQETTAADIARAMALLTTPLPTGAVTTPPDRGRAVPGLLPVGTSGIARDGEQARFAPVYFPGTVVRANAVAIVLAAGEERAGVDIPLILVRTGSVHGEITMAGTPPPRNVVVKLLSADPTTPGQGHGSTIINGQFRMTGIAPGVYRLEARADAEAAGASAGDSAVYFTSQEVVLAGGPLSVSMSLERAAKLTGDVTLAADVAAPARPGAWRVRLAPIPLLPGSFQVDRATVVVNGRFAFADLMPGRYRLSVEAVDAPVPGFFVSRVQVDGADGTDGAITVLSNQSAHASVVLDPRVARITGTLASPDQPVTDFAVLLLPAEVAPWDQLAQRLVVRTLAEDGTFAFDGLPPGNYLLSAIPASEREQLRDLGQTVLDVIAPLAVRISLSPGAHVVQAIRIARQ